MPEPIGLGIAKRHCRQIRTAIRGKEPIGEPLHHFVAFTNMAVLREDLQRKVDEFEAKLRGRCARETQKGEEYINGHASLMPVWIHEA